MVLRTCTAGIWAILAEGSPVHISLALCNERSSVKGGGEFLYVNTAEDVCSSVA